MSYRVFISYRRADQPALAQWLHDLLAGELYADEVFLDHEGLEVGEVFPERIDRAIESALVFVALIGPQWNSLVPSGNRRLDDARDFVRREVALGLKYAENDARRLLLPVLFDGAAVPSSDQLPECLRALASYQVLSIPRERSYNEGLRSVVQTVLRRLEESDTTPSEEKWIVQQITDDLLGLDRYRIRRIGQALSDRFKEIGTAPESARTLAWAIYSIGPAAVECLLALNMPDERMRALLELLATHWIRAETARTLRQTLGDPHAGSKVAIECDYADFTPSGCLLKASHQSQGWPTVKVKPSDVPEEIIQQIHEALWQCFFKRLNPRKTRAARPAAETSDVRSSRERDEICKLLTERRIDLGRPLPVVLYMDHIMALDGTLIREVQKAFPPLHILVATGELDELMVSGRFAAVLKPSETEQEEQDAYVAYADAQELIESRRKGNS